jgi:4-amino-4-deoxy-L-arabinose transferase-like glycosyltransferase
MRNLALGLTLALLPALIWLFVNATVNRHTHYLSEGYFVSHAHPYDKTPSNPVPREPHRHNEIEFLVINYISEPLALALQLFVLHLILFSIDRFTGHILHHQEPAREYYNVHHYHAPPLL